MASTLSMVEDGGDPVRRLCGALLSTQVPLPTGLIVGSVPDGVAEAPSPKWSGASRLELPFTLEVATA